MQRKEDVVEFNQIFLAVVSPFVLVLDCGAEVEGDGEDGITKEANKTRNHEID